MSNDVLERIGREEPESLEQLKEYLRIQSVSTDPAYAAEVRRCADWVTAKLSAIGFVTEQIDEGGHPLVYAERIEDPALPTIMFYGHYDVQPVDPIEMWRNDPFEPTLEGDQLVARGATDDKGQSFAHIRGVEAILAERGRLPVNVKFIIEGEEEAGGESIEAFVRRDAGAKLACDAVVVSDSSMYAPGQPSLLYGLKGLAYLEIRITGPNRDLHSGTFGGGVRNPLNTLATLVGSLVDPQTGRIQIPGFYDKVRPLEAWEREEFGKLPFVEADWAGAIGIPQTFGEQGYTTLERVWARPTCDVNGIWGGYQGKGAKTVLPGTGGAKVSMRLVPDQDPHEIAKMFTDYIQSIAPPEVQVEVEDLHGASPVLIDARGPIVEAALDAMEDVWGKRPVRIREGGSIPIVATFSQVLEVPVLLLGFGLSDDRLHAPNEKFNLPNYYGGIRSVARMLDCIGAIESKP